jgi:Phytanoyl-CoA dioxygenase (PhyH)
MHTEQLKGLSLAKIVDAIQTDGYFFVENVLTSEEADQLLGEIDFDQILINHNDVGVVISGTQKFLTHCLAKSKRAYDLITSRMILDICNGYFSERYQLTNHRFCQTRKTFHMPWHTDNNLQDEGQLCGKHSMPGLLFLFYLSDQNISPFQYIRNSHTWSQKHDHEIYLSDRWINTHCQDDILTFSMSKGSMLICDIHGIHRAAPFHDQHHVRNILLFQVDQVGDRYVGHGEQNLVNTEFIDQLDEEIFSYLGFGVKRNYPAFPSSSVATMTVPNLLILQKQLLPLTLKAVAKNTLKTLLPGELMVGLKRIIWTIKQMQHRS